MSYKELVRAAQGQIPCDVLIKNTKLINVNTAQIQENTNIGIFGERVAFIGEDDLPAKKTIDAEGMFALPGLIDTHLHIESSQVTPPLFAKTVLPKGTTTVAPDPHEIGNVMGAEGVRLMLESSKGLPLKMFWWVPTCVPSTENLETSGADIFAADVENMLNLDRDHMIGLGEIMDYEAVTSLQPRMTEIIDVGKKHGVVLDGHCMFLKGKQLNAYIVTGITGCHENFDPESAVAKLRAGMTFVKIRNLKLMTLDLPPEVQEAYIRRFIQALNSFRDKRGVLFCTDDIMPDILLQHGHMDDVLRTAIRYGYDPISAIQGATIDAATHLHLDDIGMIAPGKYADIILMRGLQAFDINTVFANGELVAKEGKLLKSFDVWKFPETARRTVKLEPPKEEDFLIHAPIQNGKIKVRAIDMAQLMTEFSIEEVEVRDWFVQPGNLTTLAIFERHGRNESKNLGLAKKGLRKGAVASTISHDSHNISVMGRDVKDMQLAVKTLIDMQGGVVVTDEGQVKATLHLPIAGLMSEEPIEVVAEQMRKVKEEQRKLGRDEKLFLSVWAIAIPVAPSARITNKYLVDAVKMVPVDLFVQ